jgi:hypothetical protein
MITFVKDSAAGSSREGDFYRRRRELGEALSAEIAY